MATQQPPLRRVSVSSFEANDIDLIMRTSPKQFTAEEIEALAALDLPDPDTEALQQFARNHAALDATGPSVSPDRPSLTAEPVHLADYLRSETKVRPPAPSRPTTAQQRARGARIGDGFDSLTVPTAGGGHGVDAHDHGHDDARPESTGRRLSQQLHQKAAESSASATGDDTKRIFTVLSRQDLVGGPETVAEAILNTHFVDLSDQALTSTGSAECFLNATHLYLQHNRLSDVDGLLLLAQLRVLVVHHNQLTSLTPLAILDALTYLDASDNAVERVDAEWDLPCASLQYLNLLGNPCCPVPRASGASLDTALSVPEVQLYRQSIESACPQLEMLDEFPTTLGLSNESDEESSHSSITDSAGADTTGEPTPAAAKPTKPTKPSTAPSDPARRAVQRQRLAGSVTPPRRASDGTRATASSSSRAQQRLAQVRADAAQHRSKAHAEPTGRRQTPPPVQAEKEAPATSTAQTQEGSEPEASGSTEQAQALLNDTRDALASGASMSRDEERLLQQFQTWAHHRREAVLATLHQPDEQEEGNDEAHNLTDRNRPYSSCGDAAYMHSKMYLDVEFADKVARDRLERSLQDTWAGVAKVRQTRMAVQAERRRQQRDALQNHSKAYQDTLQLLQKEGLTEDLQPYRREKAEAEKK